MDTCRIILVGALGVMLGALPASRAAAQAGDGWPAGSFESAYTRIRFDADGRTIDAPGLAARLMWRPAGEVGVAPSLLARTSVGLYATYTPRRDLERGARFSTLGVGGAVDLQPLAAPIAGRVDPFLTLGAGLLNTHVTRPLTNAPSPLFSSTGLALALTPGAGARLRLLPNVALQADVRDMVTFRDDDTRHNLALGAGLRVGL